MTSFLDKVYAIRNADETRSLYDDWATAYDAEVGQNGYATPDRCASALRTVLKDQDAPILDVGCGTGLSGDAFRKAGFTTIDGCDLSQGMIEEARKKNVYRNITLIDADTPFPKGYPIVAAVGVIGAGAAPISVLDAVLEALEPGGLIVFSFNDHTLADPKFADRPDALLAERRAREHVRDHGAHLPGRGLGATVYVLEKI